MEFLSYLIGYNKGLEDGGGASGGGVPDTGLIALPINGPLVTQGKVSDMTPKLEQLNLAYWLVNEDVEDGREPMQCYPLNAQPIENEEGITLAQICIEGFPLFVVIYDDLPEFGVTPGIYWAGEDIQDSKALAILIWPSLKTV